MYASNLSGVDPAFLEWVLDWWVSRGRFVYPQGNEYCNCCLCALRNGVK